MTAQPILIAIDPGRNGGIARLIPGSLADGIMVGAMPETDGDVLALLRDLMRVGVEIGKEVHCYIEQVGGFMRPSNRGPNQAAAHTMFRFGESYGFLKGVVQAIGMKLILVHPKTWQKGLGLGAKKDCASQGEWKRKLKAEAQRRFPHLGVTLKTADALLLLDYARSQ